MIQIAKNQKNTSLNLFKVIIFLLAILYSINLFSQEDYAAFPARKGFFIGAAIGGGAILISDDGNIPESHSTTSLLNLKVGYFINQTNAICLHIPSGGHNINGETRAFEAILVTCQHWFKNRLWGSAGLGLAMDMPPFYEFDNDDPEFYFGTAACAGIGYEVWKHRRFVIDVQTRLLYGNYQVEDITRNSTTLDLLIGINLY